MRIIVDRVKCENHGLCAISAPAVFELDDDGKLQYQETADDAAIGDITDAIDSCPVQAIIFQSS